MMIVVGQHDPWLDGDTQDRVAPAKKHSSQSTGVLAKKQETFEDD